MDTMDGKILVSFVTNFVLIPALIGSGWNRQVHVVQNNIRRREGYRGSCKCFQCFILF